MDFTRVKAVYLTTGRKELVYRIASGGGGGLVVQPKKDDGTVLVIPGHAIASVECYYTPQDLEELFTGVGKQPNG